MDRPTNATEVRTFLGLANYYRRFVRGYAEMAAPLNALTSKDAEKANRFIWSPKCELAFVTLKRALTSTPILAFPDYDRPFELYTDASRVAIGAVLSQRDDEGRERVVAYASRKLKNAESNYGVTELEFLSIVVWVQHFHPYLHGVQFKLFTDHQPLKGLIESSTREPKGRRARWILLLQPYTFDVIYKAGKIHHNADALSRLVCGDSDDDEAVTPEASALRADVNAVGTTANVVATVDRPRQEAAIKGAQKVRMWVTNPYADGPSQGGRGQRARGALGGAYDGADEQREKEERRVVDSDEQAEKGGEGNARIDKPSLVETDVQVPQVEGRADGVDTTGDNQCTHLDTQPTMLSDDVEQPVVGTDHTLCQPLTSSSAPQISDQRADAAVAASALATPKSDNELLQRIAHGQKNDDFLRDVLLYLHDETLPDNAARARRIATEVAQCFVRDGVLYRSWWPQRAEVASRTRVQLAVPAEMREAVMFAHHDDILASGGQPNH